MVISLTEIARDFPDSPKQGREAWSQSTLIDRLGTKPGKLKGGEVRVGRKERDGIGKDIWLYREKHTVRR